MPYLLIVVASFALGLMKPPIRWLLLMPAFCVAIGVLDELTTHETDQPNLDYFFAGVSFVLALMTGLAGYGIAQLFHRRRSQRPRE